MTFNESKIIVMSDINQEIISKLEANFEGYWEYKYKVTSGSGFDQAEIIRGGVMFVKTVADWTGLSVQINAQRLWGKRKNEEPYGLVEKVSWESFCKITLRMGGILGFTSFIDVPKERAFIKTTYSTTTDFSLESGNFVYFHDNKEIVEGEIFFRKIGDFDHLYWAPKDINFSAQDYKNLEKQNFSSNIEILETSSLVAVA